MKSISTRLFHRMAFIATLVVALSGLVRAAVPGAFTLSYAAPFWNAVAPAGPEIDLSWTSSSGATNFDVYRNGSLYSSNIGVTTSYKNQLGLTAGQTYTYYIVAKNASGNTQSNTVSVFIPTSIVPGSAPGSFTLSYAAPFWNAVAPAGPEIDLSWTSSSGATNFDVYRNGSLYSSNIGVTTSYKNQLGLTAGQTYTYYIVAKNASGNTQSNTVSVFIPTSIVPVTNYTLTVNNGSGGGSYTAGTVVNISANAPAQGQVFSQWTGATVSNASSSSTTLTMPAGNTTVTATYTAAPPQTYTLTVNNGSGGGSYTAGTVVNISANAPAQGQVFSQWTGATVSNASSSSTTLTMPAGNTTVTATYIAAPPQTYTLTVNNGSGGGSYTAGTVVNISANAPAQGQVFSQWTGATVSNASSSSTTLTMPAGNTTVTATYTAAPPQTYTLTVNNGSGGGSYTAGTVVNISANAPAQGQVFSQWTGATVSNASSSSTTLTMPAGNTTVAATYITAPPNTYTLTVSNGSGSGNYTTGTVVNISANAPAQGQVFSQWTGATVSNASSSSTTLTMPAGNTTVAATYITAPPNTYTLTVSNGSGSGNYTAGTVVNISANAPAQGQVFSQWTGATVSNASSSSTTLTMPAGNTTVAATYITAPPNTYTLTVSNGSGSGNYTAGTVVNISANAPAQGQVFSQWTGATVSNASSSSTTLTMPAGNTTVAATYITAPPNTYTLTVSNGSGSGNYTTGAVVNISANAPAQGQVFSQWTGATVSNASSSSTTLTMPAGNTTVTATYITAPPQTYTLTVNNGSGGGSYTAGAVVNISANAPAQGQVFSQWTGATVSNASSSSTTLTMPAGNTTVTATYTAAPPQTYTLTVNNGSGGGSYTAGTVVNISANAPAQGQVFSQWTGATVSNASSSSTTLTMPAGNITVTATFSAIPPPGSITREAVINTAKSYANYVWKCSSTNANATYNAFVGETTYTGVAYNWGGFDSLSQFQSKIDSGKVAGNAKQKLGESLQQHADFGGVDCSGFVSRCWNTSTKYGTGTIAPICTGIKWKDLKPGDILNCAGVHVRLFASFDANNPDLVWVYEATTGVTPGRVVYRSQSISGMQSPNTYVYTPLRYNLIIDSEGDGNGSGPVFASPLAASVSVGAVNQPVTFAATAASSSGQFLTYTWDFGDGTTGDGNTIQHIFLTAGFYTVSVSVSDGIDNSIAQLNFVVGGENDIGTDNGGDTSWTIGNKNEFIVMQSSVKLNFADGAKDVLQLSGTIPISKFFKPVGKNVTVAIGGLTQVFTLDAKAQASNDLSILKISGKMKNGVFKATPAKFAITLKGGYLESPLSDLGLENAGSSGKRVSLPTSVVLDRANFQVTKELLYKAVPGKTGSAK